MEALDLVDLSRWQFGITTVYHFIFVPLTIGLAPMVALMQTLAAITGREEWERATRFFGKVFLINFAMGVATGIVQEFQFGMNWSEYSRMVGDVFGGPLALEALIAFFLESVFLGIWIFGRGRVPAWVHALSIWVVAVAVNLSAYFIIVANSFMQHPVGAEWNEERGRAELTDIVALLTNPTALAAFPHAVAGAFLTAGTFVLGISLFWLVKNKTEKWPRPLMKFGGWVTGLAALGVAVTGDIQAKLMFEQQPMKMASAESLCVTETDPNFSILTIGTHNNCESVIHLIEMPWVLPFLAEGRFTDVTLSGVLNLQEKYEAMFGPGNYMPNLFVTYWSFRAMIGLMAGSLLLLVAAWWFTRQGRVPTGRNAWWAKVIAIAAIPTPFLANSAGWIFTEMGRQPWVVHPNLDMLGDPRTAQIRMLVDFGVSDNEPWAVVVTLVLFTLIYLALAVVWFLLIRRTVLDGAPALEEAPEPEPEPVRFGAPTSDSDQKDK